VAKVGGDETGGVDASGVPAGAYTADVPPAVTTTPVVKSDEQRKADAETAAKDRADVDLVQRRAAAKAKLPTDGSAPDGRQSQTVWVEYLVSKGSNYDDVKDASKEELQALAKQQS
jgi:hypothetical protein